MTIRRVTNLMLKVSIHEVGQTSTPIRVGDPLIFKAPSGKRYEGVVLEVDFFCGEINVLVWFETSRGKKVVTSQGWIPLSKVDFLDEVQ
jgi:hypothetical protein